MARLDTLEHLFGMYFSYNSWNLAVLKEKGVIIKTIKTDIIKSQSITVEQLAQSDLFDLSNTVYEWLGVETYKAVITLFLAEYSELTTQEKTLTHNEKLKFVHMLKGACGNIGAIHLFSTCEIIEENLRTKDISIKPLFEDLSEAIFILKRVS